MPDRSITGQNLANRRGLLMGMTLAEVMLIILFCLLLLLGKYFLELAEEKERVAACGLCASADWASALTPVEVESIGKVAVAVRSLPKEDQDDEWRRLTDELEKMVYTPDADDLTQLRKRALDAERKSEAIERQLEELEKEVERLKAQLDAAGDRESDLEEEIRRIKAGSPPPCLHEPRGNRRGLRGPSISLGAVHIEDGRMTLVAKNTAIPSLQPVDYMGRPVDYQESFSILQNWPVGIALDLEEFGRIGTEFVRIGDDESADKLKCRFTMDFYIEDGVPIAMLVDVFEKYFYKQNRLTRNELEQITTN